MRPWVPRLTALAALLVRSAAAAAPLNEVPLQALPERQPAGCLRPTGEGLALFGRPGAIDLWAAGDTGAVRGERARLGRLAQCAAVAEAGGAAVVAAPVRTGGRYAVRAAVRDAGGAFGAPVRLSGPARAQHVAAAVSPAGHAAVAWVEHRRKRSRVTVARRLPGLAFRAPEPLTGWWRSDFEEGRPVVGIDAAGTTTVAWSQPVAGFRERPAIAVAAPGAAFVSQRLDSSSTIGGSRPALAVAPDGWSILAYSLDGFGIAVYERAPMAAAFARVQRSSRTDAYDSTHDPAVAVGDGGAAVVAWRTELGDPGQGIAALTRTPGGAFGRPETVEDAPRRRSFGSSFSVLLGVGSPPYDNDARRLRAALGPGGQVLLAWTGGRPGGTSRARAATGALGGPFAAPQTLLSRVRHADAPAPLFLPDGRAAVAWIDNAGRDGRLHLAVEGAPGPVSQAPRLRVRGPRTQRLFRADPLHVSIACDRPCDVQAGVRGAQRVSVTLPGGGRRTLALRRIALDEGDLPRAGRVHVVVRATEPGGRAVARRSLRVRVVHKPSFPLWTPLDVRARRRGDAIVVRWRTAGPARRLLFSVIGTRARSQGSFVRGAFGYARGRGRMRFAVRLRPDRPRRVRWVVLNVGSLDRERSRTVLVPVS